MGLVVVVVGFLGVVGIRRSWNCETSMCGTSGGRLWWVGLLGVVGLLVVARLLGGGVFGCAWGGYWVVGRLGGGDSGCGGILGWWDC